MLQNWDAEELKDKIAPLLDGLDAQFIVSRPSTESGLRKGLFFYHIPKTGGMTLYYTLRYGLVTHRQVVANKAYVARLDASDLEDLAPKIKGFPLFVASHEKFGFHRHLGEDFDFVTVMRNPIARVKSAYTYDCMRAGKKPTAEEFKDYFTRVENQNVATRQLAAVEDATALDESHLLAAIECLLKKFRVFIDCAHIGDFACRWLSYHGASNVFIENANRTVQEYQIDLSQFDEEIMAANLLDYRLWIFVRDNPRLDFPKPKGLASAMCAVVVETEKISKTEAKGMVLPNEVALVLIEDLRKKLLRSAG